MGDSSGSSVGTVAVSTHRGPANGFGDLVTIDHGDGHATFYAYLNSRAVSLQVAGAPRRTDSGDFAYPVTAAAKCVKWGGQAGSTTHNNPSEHCG
ncbi:MULTISPECIES: hypothetical protein [unclassified Nonomuraea]|uniref:hypothetical protein n=1 Tax=unclassified Nonomuraea TaxID=2593643 RepID=UPI0033E2515E